MAVERDQAKVALLPGIVDLPTTAGILAARPQLEQVFTNRIGNALIPPAGALSTTALSVSLPMKL